VRLARATVANDIEVQVTGLCELVRGKQATFVTSLDTVEELDPEETRLVYDQSAGYRRARLYLESLLRKTPPTEPSLYIGHRAAMEPAAYQLVPAAKALAQPRPRLLIADAVGLGKTLEVGILLSELIRRGRGRRILVVTLKSMLEQFQQEMWARFTIPLVRLDSNGLARVQRKIPANMNPFYYFDRVIVSIDTLKRDEKYRRYLEQCRWDVTVIDECQHVAQRGASGSQRSQRARLANLLARTCDALVMTSATPHDGKPESFASLIQLLDPASIADVEDYRQDEIRDLYVRRFKKDVASQTRDAFAERQLRRYKIAASNEENAIFDRLVDATFQTIDSRGGKQGVLFRTLLVKSLLSSPQALLETLSQRVGKLDKVEKSGAVTHDRQLLSELRALAEKACAGKTSKHAKLVALLREAGFGPKSDARVVIFSERLKTLAHLAETLRAELKLPESAVAVFHGSLDDEKQQQLVRDFGIEKSPLRALLSSDAGSEGINLH
jgi:SNF2 family DNA or RNA helicase